MIGTNLNLVLPSLSDTMAQMVSKTATALSSIQDSIADKATPAALNINAALSLQGNALTEITSVQLADGNLPGVPGSIYYHSGEFYLQDATGVIQLTSAGAIDTAGIGGIVGDYGGVNPARVTYDDASGQYRFTQDVGVWADLVSRSLILEGLNGTVTFSVDNAIATSQQFNIKSLPAAGVSVMVFNGTTSTLEDGAVNNATIQGLTVTGQLSTGADTKHTDSWSNAIPLNPPGRPLTNAAQDTSGNFVRIKSTATSWSWTSPLHPMFGLRTGDRIKSVSSTLAVTAAGTYTFTLFKTDSSTLTAIDTWTVSGAAGFIIDSHTVASPQAIATDWVHFVVISGPNNTPDILSAVHVGWDRP